MKLTAHAARLKRLERAAPSVDAPDPELIARFHKFCAQVIEAIDAGRIVDWPTPDLLSPTQASGLTISEQSNIFEMLEWAQHVVNKFAELTGWRSGGREDWHGFRANSAAELRAIMVYLCGDAWPEKK